MALELGKQRVQDMVEDFGGRVTSAISGKTNLLEVGKQLREVIIARMLRKVKIETPGDTSLLPGLVMDKFEFRRVNDELENCLKVSCGRDLKRRMGRRYFSLYSIDLF